MNTVASLPAKLKALADEITAMATKKDPQVRLGRVAGIMGRITALLSEHGGGGEAVAWLRMTPNGEPDWAEDCIGSNDRFLDADLAADGYYLRPLTFADTAPPTPSAPVGVEERVRGVIALLRQPEPDNGEKRTEHDEGYEQASSEIADMLERILSGVSAPVGVDEAMVERAMEAADQVFARHFGTRPSADEIDTAMMRAALTAALAGKDGATAHKAQEESNG